MHIHIHTYKYMHKHTYAHIHTHIHTHTYTHAYTSALVVSFLYQRHSISILFHADTFLVTLESNPALPGIHVCFLKVTSSGLELLDLDPSHTIVSWSRRTIRGFGTTANLFQLETGRWERVDNSIF